MSCGQLLQYLQIFLGMGLLLYGVVNQQLTQLNSKQFFVLGLLFCLGLQNTILSLQFKFRQSGLFSSLALLLQLWTLSFRLLGNYTPSRSDDFILPAVSITLFAISAFNILSFILFILTILCSCADQKGFQNYQEFIQQNTKQACAVCLQNCSKGEQMIRLSCKHQFHAECIQSWLQVNPSCPLCKTLV